MIIGIDEVGRGCWAGPLLAAAVELGDVEIAGLRDSKKCSAKKRKLLSLEITQQASQIGIGWVSAKEVDAIGLTNAVALAMRRAVDQIETTGRDIIIDGNCNYLSDLKGARALVKADDIVPAVSAASIVAKVARDEYMQAQAVNYPQYGFEAHVGYGTKCHINALTRYGITQLHRRSYKPVRALL